MIAALMCQSTVAVKIPRVDAKDLFEMCKIPTRRVKNQLQNHGPQGKKSSAEKP